MNTTEREIKELKEDSDEELIKSTILTDFGDVCLEFESYLSSHNAHCIAPLDGEVHETIISGETSDINQCCEFECFESVIFHNEMEPYLDSHLPEPKDSYWSCHDSKDYNRESSDSM